MKKSLFSTVRFTCFLLMILFFTMPACRQETPPRQETAADTGKKFYTEPYRPQYHFSPPAKWMNDPNGMVYFDGEYHLFYQYFPDSTVWGPMHWGHAISRDLVNWEHQPVALYPDSLGYIFSGSAVVDTDNTSGLGSADQPPLVAIFTYHDPKKENSGANNHQTQGIAYSLNRGRAWQKYSKNPVIKNPGLKDFRDPKVFWHRESNRWVMILAAGDRVRLYNSPNLIDWEFASEFGAGIGSHGGVWECPDLLKLTPRESETPRWVMLVSINPGGPQGGSATQYFVGDFDGKTFTLDKNFAQTMAESSYDKSLWVDYGRDNYAGVTWSNTPDGRRIFLGWMSNWDYAQVVPTSPWRSAMTLPRTLSLRNTPMGYRLISTPATEISSLRTARFELEPHTIGIGYDFTERLGFPPNVMEALLEFELPYTNVNSDFGLELSNSKGESYRIGFNAATQQFYSDRTKAGPAGFSDKFLGKIITAPPRNPKSYRISMRLFIDKSSVELFGDDGAVVMTEQIFPGEEFNRVRFYSENGEVELTRATFYSLKSVWAPMGAAR